MLHHDGASGSIHNRKLHADCLQFGGGTFAMATRTTDGFSSDVNGTQALTARATEVGPRERFFPEHNDDGTLSLKFKGNNKYVSVASNGQLTANKTSVGDTEKFDIIHV